MSKKTKSQPLWSGSSLYLLCLCIHHLCAHWRLLLFCLRRTARPSDINANQFFRAQGLTSTILDLNGGQCVLKSVNESADYSSPCWTGQTQQQIGLAGSVCNLSDAIGCYPCDPDWLCKQQQTELQPQWENTEYQQPKTKKHNSQFNLQLLLAVV